MRAYIIIAGEGYDLNRGHVHKMFVDSKEHQRATWPASNAWLTARKYLDDWLEANGGNVRIFALKTNTSHRAGTIKQTGWELGGIDFSNGQVHYRWRQDGEIKPQFVALRVINVTQL